jgi:hypothetical protein
MDWRITNIFDIKIIIVIIIIGGMVLNSELYACKEGTIPLEPNLQSILL